MHLREYGSADTSMASGMSREHVQTLLLEMLHEQA